MSHGTFAWNELRTNDVEGAKTFYGETIGWTFEEMPLPEGHLLDRQIRRRAGGRHHRHHRGRARGTPPHWFAYLAVDDVDERVEEIALNKAA
jgi:Predicted enzyme related to lactoylglutathione lyase